MGHHQDFKGGLTMTIAAATTFLAIAAAITTITVSATTTATTMMKRL
jgi:hypothetical protein